ncbi:MAG: hypothetical protein ACM3ZV_07350 [Bacillota bacterium]
MHEISESTKRVIDAIALVLMGVAGSLTLANIALVVSIIGGLLSIAWHVVRFYDRHRGRVVAE